MKNVLRLAGCMSILAIALSSCTKEDDVKPEDDSQIYNGSWNVSENSKEYGTSKYTVTINYLSSASVTINKLYSLTKGTVASVNGNNLTIQPQTIDWVSLSGTGVRENSNRLSFKYYVKLTAKKTDTVTICFYTLMNIKTKKEAISKEVASFL